jgi:hypothetical protein
MLFYISQEATLIETHNMERLAPHKSHYPTLNGATVASISEVCTTVNLVLSRGRK